MTPLILLSGSLGAGKTRVGRLLADRLPDGVHMESDLFYGFFRLPIAPHLPQAERQNRAAIAAACQAAGALNQQGYSVVLDGVFGPWVLPWMTAQLDPRRVDVRYLVLRTSREAAIERVRGRSGPGLDGVVAAMHPQFERLGEWEPHALDTTHLTPGAVVEQLLGELSRGRFKLSAPVGA